MTPKKIKPARIIAIVDRSGSMSSVRTDAEGGLNTFLEEQRLIDAPCRLTLAQFDNDYELLWDDIDLHTLKERYNLIPRGSTALLDAVGKTINAVRPNVKKKEQVFVVIVTDGYENASREWNREQIKKLLEEVQELGWNVSFIGAGIDAFAEASAMGINHNTTLQSNTVGAASYGAHSHAVTTSRMAGSSLNYSDEEREMANKS